MANDEGDLVDVARAEIAAGRAWAARDRLAGALAHRPTDPDVLDLLGRAWADLGEPAQAGRWWYLVDRDDAEAVAARAAFRARHDDDPLRIVSDLRVFAPLSAWPGPVRERLSGLAEAVEARGERWSPGRKPSWSSAFDPEPERWYETAITVLIVVAACGAVGGVWLFGAVSLLDLLFG